jgi:hypothetical protein
LVKQVAKEVGIKQKYIIFRATRYLNKLNNSITYYNKDLIYEHKDLIDDYLHSINLNNIDYEPLTYNFGKIHISSVDEVSSPTSDDKFITLKFSIDFQITMTDDLPIYMNNLIGLMFKKMFYNVKLYIDNLNLNS